MPPLMTKGVYPVAWDPGEFVMHGRLQFDNTGWLARWNGFVCPSFTREEVDRYARWITEQPNDELDGDAMYDTVEWNGDVLVLTSAQWPDSPERIEPVEGLYAMGAYNWTWVIVEAEL